MRGAETELAAAIAGRVADVLAGQRGNGNGPGEGMTADDQRAYARQLIASELANEAHQRLRDGVGDLTSEVEEEVAAEAYARLFGLGRLQRYLDDPRVTDIHVQGCDSVWIKHADGSCRTGDPVADNDVELVELLRSAAARMGRTERRFDAADPVLNLHLPDGSRLTAVMEVCPRPSVTIRKHQFDLAFLADLRATGTFDDRLEAFLRAAVLARQTIVIAGGIGCGKTTLMRALINEIPPEERLVTVEDPAELGIDRFGGLHPNMVSLEARQPNIEGQGAITLEQLVRLGLRMDPHRVFVGEVSGPEVLPMLLAMSQGRDGSMCTVHADSARNTFQRLQMYGRMAPHRLEFADTAMLTASAVDLVVHVDRRSTGDGVRRVVTGVLEVRGVDGAQVVANEVFREGDDGTAVPTGAIHGQTLNALVEAGLDRRTVIRSGGRR